MSPASERDIAEQRVLDARAAEAALRAEFLRQERADCAESVKRGNPDAVRSTLSLLIGQAPWRYVEKLTLALGVDVSYTEWIGSNAPSERIADALAASHTDGREELLLAFLEGAGIEVNICGRDGRPLTVEAVREIGAFYARLMARPTDEAPLPITAVQVRAALALAESQPASTDATDLSISLEHLLRWIESGRQYPRPAREAPCVHQFTASAAGAPPSEYMPRLEDSVCAKCGVPFQSATRTDDRRENDRHPARQL